MRRPLLSRLQTSPEGQDEPKHGDPGWQDTLSALHPMYPARHDRLRPPLGATNFSRLQRFCPKGILGYPSRHEAQPLKHDRDSPRRFPTPWSPTSLSGSGPLPAVAIPRVYSGPQTRPSIISQGADRRAPSFEDCKLSTF